MSVTSQLAFRITVLLVAFGSKGAYCDSGRPEQSSNADDAECLKVFRDLRWKAASFNNVSAIFSRHETIQRSPLTEWMSDSFNASKFGGESPPKPAETEPYELEKLSRIQLTVRGDELTIEHRSQQDGRGEPLVGEFRSRSTDIREGLLVSISDSPHGPPTGNHRSLWIDHLEPHALLYESQREIEFVFGVGFGSLIKSVESVERIGDMRTVKATMQFWDTDTTSATLLIDNDDIVRKATLRTVNENGIWLTEVTTSGTIEPKKGIRYAASGSYDYRTTHSFHTGFVKKQERVRNRFTTSSHRIIWNLTDEKYHELTEIDETNVDSTTDNTKRRRPNYIEVF